MSRDSAGPTKPTDPQPTAGGVRQPTGTEKEPEGPERERPAAEVDRSRSDEEHVIGDPDRVDDRREVTDTGFDEP